MLPHGVENDSVILDEGVQRQLGIPKRDTVSFWKVSGLTMLKECAKITFSVPVSSAGIERLFSGAGMQLTKQRKRTLPNIMKKWSTSGTRKSTERGSFGNFYH